MITYFRDSVMPDSPPDSKHNVPPSSLPPLSLAAMAAVTSAGRPLSTSSSVSGMNGAHSPLSGINGRTPSPPTGGSMLGSSGGGGGGGGGGMGQQLPPACGARQLSKLKRFLTTLQQFGSDISPEIGERVRTLVLGLVNSHLSIEEFHTKLQEATNFPLRPFVIPFLKANLPLLQRELLHCARMAKQTPQQFLTHNEHVVFDPTHSPLDPHDPVTSDLNENGKRRASPENRPKENGSMESLMSEGLHPAKRHHPGNNNNNNNNSPLGSRISPNGSLNLGSGGQIRLEDISLSRELRERERLERERAAAERERAAAERERERERHYSGSYNYNRSDSFDPLERLDDDWRHVETMLNCILGMVDKTKRAMAVLQERSLRDREELSAWVRRHAEGLLSSTPSSQQPPDALGPHPHPAHPPPSSSSSDLLKKHHPHHHLPPHPHHNNNNNNNNNSVGGGGGGGGAGDMMAFAVRQTEDRVSDVRRRAEDAVNEVKRQAMVELQKAVQAAESKASEMVMSERLRMERVLQQARSQARDEILGAVNHQEESSESCWNCGRKASETCSGCNVARYCGSFCQHKDWESHHLVCGKSQVAAIAQARDNRRGGAGGGAGGAGGMVPNTTSTIIPTTALSSSSSSSSSSSAVVSAAGASSSLTLSSLSTSSGAPAAVPKEMPSTTTTTSSSSTSSSLASELTPTPTTTNASGDVTPSATSSSAVTSAGGVSSEARGVASSSSPACSESSGDKTPSSLAVAESSR